MLIVFSPSQRRPGCVILQAALGGTVPRDTFSRLFSHTTWLVAPTDDMAAYPVDDPKLEMLAVMAKEAVK